MKCLIFAVFLISICLHSTYSRHVQFYRRDYKYIQEFDAFYKVHFPVIVNGSAWSTAFLTCVDEGATLFYPEAQGEWALVKKLTDQMKEFPNVTDILVGLHDEFKLGEFITVDGHSTPYPLPADKSLLPHLDRCIAMNIDTGKFNVESCLHKPLPYACKKVDDDDESCPTIDHGYKFIKKSRKCYKINKYPQKWQEAMKTCFMEGGILAVIENHEQAQQITDILQQETYFVGVKKLFPRGDYYTVKGQKFSDMYQTPFNNVPNPNPNVQKTYNYVPNEYGHYPNENGYYPDENGNYPDENGNFLDENGQYLNGNKVRVHAVHLNIDCGVVTNRGNLYTETRNCDEPLPFICEMEVGV